MFLRYSVYLIIIAGCTATGLSPAYKELSFDPFDLPYAVEAEKDCNRIFSERYQWHPGGKKPFPKEGATVFFDVRCRAENVDVRKEGVVVKVEPLGKDESGHRVLPASEISIGFLLNRISEQYRHRNRHTHVQNGLSGDIFGPIHYFGFMRTLDFMTCKSAGFFNLLRVTREKHNKDFYPESTQFLYLVLEQMQGVPLYVILRDVKLLTHSTRKPSLDYLRSSLIQIMSSLWYASHEVWFTHWDLHVGNIMLDRDSSYGFKELLLEFTVPKERVNGNAEPLESFGQAQDFSAPSYSAPAHRSYFATNDHSDFSGLGLYTSRNSQSGHSRKIVSAHGIPFGQAISTGPARNFKSLVSSRPRSLGPYDDNKRLHSKDHFDSRFFDSIGPEQPIVPRRFRIPLAATHDSVIKIIDFGRSYAYDTTRETKYHQKYANFAPHVDIRYLAMTLVEALPILELRRIFVSGGSRELPESGEFRELSDLLFEMLGLSAMNDELRLGFHSALEKSYEVTRAKLRGTDNEIKEEYADKLTRLHVVLFYGDTVAVDGRREGAMRKFLATKWVFLPNIDGIPATPQSNLHDARALILKLLDMPFFAKYRANGE